MNAQTRIARVGEIVGKNGIPLEFPKSDIDGIAFQNDDDMPWIDVDLHLAYPGVPGVWSVFYHATSNNKLKRMEWQGYISRVTMSVQQSPGVVKVLASG
jgi:ABC-type taurine transport system ATPase subunit